jgi:hypothetical protein
MGYPIIAHHTFEDGLTLPIVDAPELPMPVVPPEVLTPALWWKYYGDSVTGWAALISIPVMIWIIIQIFAHV